ncbi:SapC family protein [Shewanella psychrotolerans]|uniref:SapC family protein n=1 Tax=Shewanella psychrotolerans TaxID=2864206 RepID=UPI001C657586|nr:SapC family protein [Shewanella psychrotolerans]QYK00590.1 SapC family protein [Shewanella psychrotolerans]
MTQIVPLSSEKHLNIKLTHSSDYTRFAKEHLIPVLAREIPNLAAEFPIVFVKNTENGQFLPVAMMGIKPDTNLYCQSTEWSSPVTPLGFNNAPLSIAKTPEKDDKVIVCIDEDSPMISQEAGSRLFTDSGEKTEYLTARTNSLLDVAAMHQQTQGMCQYLAQKNLLNPQQLTLKLDNQQQNININGVYVIDDDSFNAISDEDFLELKNKGLLPIIYAHRASLNQLSRLIAKQNQHDSSQ